MNNWIQLTEKTLPEPNKLVWIKRTSGNIYLGARKDKDLSTHPDPSRECHWWGNPTDNCLETTGYACEIECHSNFSDVTVLAWMEIGIPSA